MAHTQYAYSVHTLCQETCKQYQNALRDEILCKIITPVQTGSQYHMCLQAHTRTVRKHPTVRKCGGYCGVWQQHKARHMLSRDSWPAGKQALIARRGTQAAGKQLKCKHEAGRIPCHVVTSVREEGTRAKQGTCSASVLCKTVVDTHALACGTVIEVSNSSRPECC
jgi:hypothetical protein